MHLVFAPKKIGNVLRCEKIRCAMRAVQHANLPVVRIHRGGHDGIDHSPNSSLQMQHITEAQAAPAVPAKLAQREGGTAAQIFRQIEAAAHCQIGAATSVKRGPHLQYTAGADLMQAPESNRLAIEAGGRFGASQRNHRSAVEAQGGATHRAFECRRPFCVANQCVRSTQGEIIHRPRGRHTDIPIAETAGPILHTGLHTGFKHIQSIRTIVEAGQEAGGLAPFAKYIPGKNLREIGPVGFNAMHTRLRQHAQHAFDCCLAGIGMHYEFCHHRVVVRRHFRPGRHGRFDTHAIREGHFGQQAG